ncbi:ireA, partial [Symbiodinium sp. CCMP2456]
MALASALTEKSLAKFRTKPCERLLTKNECSFGDRCQYAHSVPRRNPKNVSYSPEMCSSPATCHLGDACPKAHTVEECLYHPTMYRTQLCPEKKQCTVFYCPHAHAEEELRGEFAPPALALPAPLQTSTRSSGPLQPGMVRCEDPPRWWPAGDQKDLHVRNSGEVPPLQSYGFELCGGLVRPAKYVPDAGLEAQPCFAKLLSTSRSESQLANRVVKDLKRWLSKTPLPAPFFLRRTVATTALAVPSHFRVLGKTLESLPNGVLQEARKCWAVTQLVAKWIRQLVTGLEALHDLDIAHSCIGPSTILVGPGVGGLDIRVGDFLGKVTTLRFLENGCSSLDESWAMWYPAEVHLHVSTAVPAGATHFSSKTAAPDLMRVDSWQLGVLIFFLLTGAHPFGNVDCPGHVCSNIRAGNVVNRKKLQELPLFLELVDRLIASEPHRRLKVSQVSCHPVFWDLQEGFEFAKPVLTDPRRAREQEWLYHLPCFAVFAPPTRDAPRMELLSKLCQKVLDIGNKRRNPHKGLGTICVQLLSEIDRHRPVQAPQHAPNKCASSPPSSIPPPRPDEATYFQAGMRRGVELMAGFAHRAFVDSLMQPPPGLGPSITQELLLQRCSLAAAEMVLYQQQHCQAQYRQGLHEMEREAQDWRYGHIPQQDFSLYHPDPDRHSMLMHEYDTCAWQRYPSTLQQRGGAGSPSRAEGASLLEAPRTPEMVRTSRPEPDSAEKLARPPGKADMARADAAQNQKISTPGCRSAAVSGSPEDNQGGESGREAASLLPQWTICCLLRLGQMLAQSEAQNALAQCLSDFEVVPELVPKAAAFSVFREVAKTAIVPREVQMKVAPDEVGESGRFFTYSHFACSLAVTAQRAFASAGASSLVRLMQWMDASKGRVLFSQNFPGTAPKGCAISLKVLPEMDKLPEDVQRDLAAVTLKQATGQEPAQSRQEAPAPGEEVGRPRRSRSVTSLTREPRAAAAPLPEWARLEIQKTFGHYASLGDPLNRSTLTSQKFGRFLRDCGLLAIEADGPVSFDFAPEGRRASVRRPSKSGQESATGLARSNSAGALRRSSFGGRTGPRGSIGLGDGAASSSRRASFAVSSAQAAQANVQLPLRVFPVPPLTQVEVDLIFVQATRPVDTPERRKSVVQVADTSDKYGGVNQVVVLACFCRWLSICEFEAVKIKRYQADHASQIFSRDSEQPENHRHPCTAVLDAVQARHKGIPVSSWAMGQSHAAIVLADSSRLQRRQLRQSTGTTSEQSARHESDQFISQMVSRLQVADANWKLQQWRGDISRDYFEEEIVPQSPRTILPLARIAARGHGFLSGAELAGVDAAHVDAGKAGEAKTVAVDVAPIPGYDPSSIAGWRLHPPSSDQAEAEAASDSAFQTAAVVEPDPIFDSVFPEKPLPGRPQHQMVPKDVAAAGQVHVGVQTRPEEVELHESSNQRFAREAVARIGLVPLTICDAAACPEFRLQRCQV